MRLDRNPVSWVQVLRFGIVGIANTALDLTVFWLLTMVAGASIFVGNSLAYSAGILSSFVLNRVWTFRNLAFEHRVTVQLPLFVLVSLVGLSISNLSLWLFSQVLPLMAAKLSSIGLTFIWNFFGSKRMVFPGRHSFSNS